MPLTCDDARRSPEMAIMTVPGPSAWDSLRGGRRHFELVFDRAARGVNGRSPEGGHALSRGGYR
jgi:hypothetical protein